MPWISSARHWRLRAPADAKPVRPADATTLSRSASMQTTVLRVDRNAGTLETTKRKSAGVEQSVRRIRRHTAASALGALVLGAAIVLCGARPASAAQRRPSPALIEGLIVKYDGGQSATHRFQFSKVQVAASYVIHIGEIYGLKGGTRVWPVRAVYSDFTAAGDIKASWSSCSRTDRVAYFYLYKDAFDSWAAYATSHAGSSDKNSYYGPCPRMPGVGIFSTALPPSGSS